MKNYILNILNNVINEGKNVKDNYSYDIAFLKEIVDKIKNDKNYFYNYILDINNDLIKELSLNITPNEERDSFIASIMYIKNLCEINKKEEVVIPLSNVQEELLLELLELIKQIIQKDEKRETDNQKNYKKHKEKYNDLVNKIKNNEELSIDDYDLIEELILKYEKGNVYDILNSVIDYLNNYNYRLLSKNIEEIKEVEGKELELETKEPEEEIKVENEEVFSKEEPIIIEKPSKEENISLKETNTITEKPKKKKSKIKLDIFKPQSFVIEEEKTKKARKTKNSKSLENENTSIKLNTITNESNEINETDIILSKIGISKENFNEYCANLLNNGINEEMINYYNENLKTLFIENNYNSIISILCLSDLNTLTEIFNYFKEINIKEDTIKDLINRATQIFFTKNKGLFKANVNIIMPYNSNIEELIKNNITYFYNAPEYNQNKISILLEHNVNISKLLEIKPQILAIGTQTIIKNIDLLEKYSISINDENYDSISIISSPNLNIMIDTFIESGFSIHFNHDGLRNIRTLIIKRIFYAFKNKLNVWDENYTLDRQNNTYEQWINKERRTLEENEILNLLNGYPLLQYIESSKKPIFFYDVNSAQIRRKYEYKFDNNVISRLKVFSIFNVLINHNINEKDALIYAITYGSNLNPSEYDQIKNDIIRK